MKVLRTAARILALLGLALLGTLVVRRALRAEPAPTSVAPSAELLARVTNCTEVGRPQRSIGGYWSELLCIDAAGRWWTEGDRPLRGVTDGAERLRWLEAQVDEARRWLAEQPEGEIHHRDPPGSQPVLIDVGAPQGQLREVARLCALPGVERYSLAVVTTSPGLRDPLDAWRERQCYHVVTFDRDHPPDPSAPPAIDLGELSVPDACHRLFYDLGPRPGGLQFNPNRVPPLPITVKPEAAAGELLAVMERGIELGWWDFELLGP